MILRQLAVELFVIVAIGAVLGLLGPFGTYDMPAAPRLFYWVGFAVVGYAVFRPVQTVAAWASDAIGMPVWLAMVLAAMLASLPLTVLVGFAMSGMHVDIDVMGAGFAILYLQVLGVGLGILVAMRLLFRNARIAGSAESPDCPVQAEQAQSAPKMPTPRFLDRLPPALGSDLIALEMEDHYVRAHTALGSELILMRLRDAVAELDGIEGMQVHRSWWVARAAVEDVTRDGRNLRLVLDGGLEAPVSRANVAALKEAGWI